MGHRMTTMTDDLLPNRTRTLRERTRRWLLLRWYTRVR